MTRGRQAAGADAKAVSRLREIVWDRLAPSLSGCDTVLVAPDGPLCALPLGALPGKEKGTFLIEDVAIATVASVRQLLELHGGASKPGEGLVAVGGLEYGKGGGSEWKPLPGTRLEAERVKDRFRAAFPHDKARLLSGPDATRESLVRGLGAGEKGARPRVLHVATHGWFAPEGKGATDPSLSSGLVLANANATSGGGVLTALEVRSLDLRGCELAVLSACDTGLGRVAHGEGVLGLQRAFHLAGARTTVTSLWKVSDAVTAVMMEEFYDRLWKDEKMTKLEALRQAQRWVLRNPDKVVARAKKISEEVTARSLGKVAEAGPALRAGGYGTSPVAWWAGFVLCGDVGPVRR
jgi:CHAT domain-containing protein